MPSCPITDSSLEGDWLWEVRVGSFVAVDTLRRDQEGSSYLRDGVDQLTLMEGSLLGPANLEEGRIHTGKSLSPSHANVPLPISYYNPLNVKEGRAEAVQELLL